MNVSGEPLLHPGLVARALAANPALAMPVLAGELYAYGRQALAAGLQRVPPGRVLAPAFICDTAVHGIEGAGRLPAFYPLRDDLTPEWDYLDSRSMSECAAMVLVHYFGIARDVEKAVGFCGDRGLILIEDCAHAFLSEHHGQPLGSFGDLAIFSYRKTGPLRNGAGLKAPFDARDRKRAQGGSVVADSRTRALASAGRFLAREGLKWFLFRHGGNRLRARFAPALSDEKGAPGVDPQAMDRLSIRIVAAESERLPLIRQVRRRNYTFLARELLNLPRIRLLSPDLPEGACPWAFPLAVDGRDDLLALLLREGVGAWAWPDLPQSVSRAAYPETHVLAESTLLLPIHQDLSLTHMRYIADTVVAWALMAQSTE